MYPLVSKNERILQKDYTGLIVTCDVDKTYLDTHFSSASGLLRIPLEWAQDKQTVAGMAPLLRELRFGGGATSAQTPLYFLTASPPPLIPVLERKMLLDEVQADGITCKDWKAVLLKRMKPAWLKRQYGYKLCALFEQRAGFPPGAKEILIGDNAEADGRIYSLYADTLSGRINVRKLDQLLSLYGCDHAEREEVSYSLNKVKLPCDPVERIFIARVRARPDDEFADFTTGLVPCHSALTMALCLCERGYIRKEAVGLVLADLIDRKEFSAAELKAEALGALGGGHLSRTALEKKLRPVLLQAGVDIGDSLPKFGSQRISPDRKKKGNAFFSGTPFTTD